MSIYSDKILKRQKRYSNIALVEEKGQELQMNALAIPPVPWTFDVCGKRELESPTLSNT